MADNFSAESYKHQLLSLFPSGVAWDDARTGNLGILAQAMADELARVDVRALQLALDWIPSNAIELLPDWQRALALPDNCYPDQSQSLGQRQAAAVEKFTRLGLQTPAYFVSLAARLGYTVTIEEYFPFSAGAGVAGGAVVNESWAYTWKVNVQGTQQQITDFEVGRSSVGEALRMWGSSLIECVINRQKPAHTVAIFSYEG